MFVILDLETTGTDKYFDEIIEIAIIKVDSKTFEIKDSFNTLIKPSVEIPEIISSITGITNNDVEESPIIGDIGKQIYEFIGDLPILGHNVGFDIDFLKNANIYFSSHIILDTMFLANFLVFDSRSLSLENLSLYFKIDIKGSHRALYDVENTLELFKKLVTITQKLDLKQKEILNYFLLKTNDLGYHFFIKHYIGDLKDKIDKTQFNKKILKSSLKIKKNKLFTIKKDLQVDKIVSSLEGLEIRKNQEKMLDIVDKTLTDKKMSIIEAPTGLGKTFAYLIPSIIFSLKNNTQVFVSTTTKTLQDQIFYKDLEYLRENIENEFSYTKLKGKNNYISYFGFFRFLESKDNFNLKELSFIIKITFWLLKTNSFELDELDYIGEEYSFLKEINADNLLVFSNKNPFYKQEPIIKIRNNVKNSNIVILNNSLLFQDIDNDNLILGKIRNLVLDEAHNLEDVVTNALKKSFLEKDVQKKILSIIKVLQSKNYENTFKIEKLSQNLLFNLNLLFDYFKEYFDYYNKFNNDNNSILLKEDFFNVDKNEFNLDKLTKTINFDFLSLLDNLYILPEELYIELSNDISFLENIVDIVDKILNKENTDLIKIIFYSEKNGLGLSITKLNIGKFLQSKLWSNLDSCVLTSATLSIGNDFSYFKKMFFLDDFKEFILKSDFDYKKQSLVFYPKDIGYIKNNIGEVIDFLAEFISIVRGQTLVLFRALATIKEVFIELKKDKRLKNIDIFAQGIGGSKHKLLNLYKKNYKKSIIMGSDTFWEGIDLKGEELKYLIIHKIPFVPPNDPIFEARSNLFKDPFKEYSIAKAILKLKQGFGRLIRTKLDSGIVIFLDNRAFTTLWGKEILTAFPTDIKIKKAYKKELFDILKIITKKNNKK